MMLNRARLMSRRSLLGLTGGGIGAVPFLPLLQPRAARAASSYPRRLIVMLGPLNGLQPGWVPSGTGTNFTLGQRLAPLTPFRDRLLVLSGLDGANYIGFADGHKHGMAGLWTASTYDSRTGWPQNRSVDQEIARVHGNETPFRSVQFGVQADLEANNVFANMIYSGPNSPISAVSDPYKLIDRLFGGGESGMPGNAAGERLRFEQKSIVDEVRGAVDRLASRVGASDRYKLQAHIEALRAIEKRLDGTAGAGPSATTPTCMVPTPAGPRIDLRANDSFPALYRLQTDLMVAALACDRTRIVSFQPLNSISTAIFKWAGVTTDFHFGTMHGRDEAARVRINDWFVAQFTYLLEALDAVPEGEGTLLDHTTVVWAGEFAQGNHANNPTPFLMAGGGKNPGWKLGRHLALSDTRHARVLQTLLHSYGIEIARFGDLDEGLGPLPGLL
jgi:hypothetical protein